MTSVTSTVIQPYIDRLSELADKIDVTINAINTETSPDLTSYLSTLDDIKIEQDDIYGKIVDINANLAESFKSAETLNKHQSNLDGYLTSYKGDLLTNAEDMKDQTNNSIRLSKINNYYSDKYNAHTQIVKTIIYVLISAIIISILKRKEIIPQDVFVTLMLVIVIISSITILKKIKNVTGRSNNNFQEYDWNFREDLVPET